MTIRGPYEIVHHYMGLSTDTKPSAAIGDEFFETNTRLTYIYNGTTWSQKVLSASGAGAYVTSTDPAANAAVTTTIVDAYSGVIITLTAGGNAQTIQSPTIVTAGKMFTVINDDASAAFTIAVNGITLAAGKSQSFIWDGSAWGPVDIGITSLPVPIAQGGTGVVTVAEIKTLLHPAPGAIGGTTPSTGLFTTLGVGTGVTAPATTLQVVDTVSTSPRGIMGSQHNTGTDGARFHMRKSRNTFASPAIVVTGDTLGKLVASGWDGAVYQEMGAIAIECEGTIAAGRIPTRIVLSTATDAATSVLTERMRIDSAGNTSLGKSDGTAGSSLTIEGTLGPEKVQYGDFSEDLIWVKGANWTIAGGVATKSAGASNNLSQDCSEVAGETYKVVYTINSISGGSLTMSIGGTSGTSRSGAGTYTEYITAITTGDLTFTPSVAGVACEIDNVPVKKVTLGTLTLPGPLLVQGYGSSAAPAIRVGASDSGIFLSTTGLTLVSAGTRFFSGASGQINAWTNYFMIGTSADLYLFRTAAGSMTIGGTGQGQFTGLKMATTLLTIASGTSTHTWASAISANCHVEYVSTRVTVQPPGTATYDVGVAGDLARFSDDISTAINTTNPGPAPTIIRYTSATDVVITTNANPSDGTGRIRITVHYKDCTPATS